jgi:hypothetical protein
MIDAGSMSVVYRAKDTKLKRDHGIINRFFVSPQLLPGLAISHPSIHKMGESGRDSQAVRSAIEVH